MENEGERIKGLEVSIKNMIRSLDELRAEIVAGRPMEARIVRLEESQERMAWWGAMALKYLLPVLLMLMGLGLAAWVAQQSPASAAPPAVELGL